MITIQQENSAFVNTPKETEINLDIINIDYSILPREGVDEAHVAILEAEISFYDRQNESPHLDPIHVFDVDGEYVLARGLYRYHAYKKYRESVDCGEFLVPVTVFSGSKQDLIHHIATSKAGEKPIKGYSQKEKQRLAELYLQVSSNRPPAKSFNQMSMETAISDKTLKRIWESAVELPDGTLKFEERSNVLTFPKAKRGEAKEVDPEPQEDEGKSSEFRTQEDYCSEDHGDEKLEERSHPIAPRQINDVRPERERMQAEIEQLKQELAQANKELALLAVIQNERDDYKARLAEMTAIAEQQNNAVPMLEEIDKLSKKNKELQQEIGSLENELRSFRNDQQREIAKGSGWAKRVAGNAVHGLTHAEVLSDFSKLQSDDARAAFARTWLAKSSEALNETWGAFYSLLGAVKEGELYKKQGSLSGSTTFDSFQDYFDSNIKSSFETFKKLESETEFLISSLYPDLLVSKVEHPTEAPPEQKPHPFGNKIMQEMAQGCLLVAHQMGSTAIVARIEKLIQDNFGEECLKAVLEVSESEKILKIEQERDNLLKRIEEMKSQVEPAEELKFQSNLQQREILKLNSNLEIARKEIKDLKEALENKGANLEAIKIAQEVADMGGLKKIAEDITQVAALKSKLEMYDRMSAFLAKVSDAAGWTPEEKKAAFLKNDPAPLEKLGGKLPKDPKKAIETFVEHQSGFNRLMEAVFGHLKNVPLTVKFNGQVSKVADILTGGIILENRAQAPWLALYRGHVEFVGF